MTVTMVAQTAEAVCGALHHLGYQFLGETGDGRSTFWCRGQAPQIQRVEVWRDEPFVRVVVEWPNVSAPPRIVRTKIVLRIDCAPDVGRARIEEATQGVVERCLEIYADVLTGTGHAGPDYLKRQTPRRS